MTFYVYLVVVETVSLGSFVLSLSLSSISILLPVCILIFSYVRVLPMHGENLLKTSVLLYGPCGSQSILLLLLWRNLPT